MAGRSIGFLDSYDILGKAIPGVVLLFGLVLILPSHTLVDTNASINIKSLAAIFVASAVAGVVFGEGVHTIARIVEKLLAWATKRITAIYRVIYQFYTYSSKQILSSSKQNQDFNSGDTANSTPDTDNSSEKSDNQTDSDTPNDEPDNHEKSPITKLLDIIVAAISHQFSFTEDTEVENLRPLQVNRRFRRGMSNVTMKFSHAFISHRSLFSRFVSERATRTRGAGPEDIRFKHFSEAVSKYYDLPADAFRNSDSNIYPLLTSHLDASGVNRSRRFQGRYSFTRSMWLSTLILSAIYFSIYCAQYAENIGPSLESIFASPPPMLLTGVTQVGVVLGLWLIFSSGTQWVCQWYRNQSTGVFLPWGVGASFLIISTSFWSWIISSVSSYFWKISETVTNEFFDIGRTAGEYIQFLIGVDSTQEIFIVMIAGEGLLGLSIFLFVSTLAFVLATGSYKRNYVEYTIVDAWESLEGAGSDGMSIEIEEGTMEQLKTLFEN